MKKTFVINKDRTQLSNDLMAFIKDCGYKNVEVECSYRNINLHVNGAKISASAGTTYILLSFDIPHDKIKMQLTFDKPLDFEKYSAKLKEIVDLAVERHNKKTIDENNTVQNRKFARQMLRGLLDSGMKSANLFDIISLLPEIKDADDEDFYIDRVTHGNCDGSQCSFRYYNTVGEDTIIKHLATVTFTVERDNIGQPIDYKFSVKLTDAALEPIRNMPTYHSGQAFKANMMGIGEASYRGRLSDVSVIIEIISPDIDAMISICRRTLNKEIKENVFRP